MLALHGDFDANEVGEPGPWGSDPKHTFTGIDTISRSKNDFSDYLAHYQADFSERVRGELFGTFFLNNNGYQSAYPFNSNKDLRVQGEGRTIVSVTRGYTVALGVSDGLEEVRNTYITDAESQAFPIRRRDTAVYLENQFEIGGRLFLEAGARVEFLHTASIPSDGYMRPFFPAQTISRGNPKLAAAYVWRRSRFHASFGTGMRPPAWYDLAYTNNPALRPERTRSFDAGVEQRLFHDRLSLDGTYFYNRFYDLIVIAGRLAFEVGAVSDRQHRQLPGARRGVFGRAAAGAMGLRHRLVHAAEDRNPFAQRVGESRAGAVPAGPGTGPQAGEFGSRGGDVHTRQSDGGR